MDKDKCLRHTFSILFACVHVDMWIIMNTHIKTSVPRKINVRFSMFESSLQIQNGFLIVKNRYNPVTEHKSVTKHFSILFLTIEFNVLLFTLCLATCIFYLFEIIYDFQIE